MVLNAILNSYATGDVAAKAASEIELFRTFSNRTAVQFVEALKDKARGCKDAFSKQQTKSIFVSGFPLNVRFNMHMY